MEESTDSGSEIEDLGELDNIDSQDHQERQQLIIENVPSHQEILEEPESLIKRLREESR